MIIKKINPKEDLIFDIKTCEACKSCKRYGLTGCCPPYIGNFEYYQKLLKSYKNGKIFAIETKITNSLKWKEIGRQSSLKLHRILLQERQDKLNQGHYFNVILGGGSCKYCNKCSIPCKLPQFRAIPIEATGINVVTTLKKLGISIKFPVKENFYRIGLLLWD